MSQTERLRAAAREVVEAYYDRFSTVTGQLLGPIDSQIEDLERVLEAPLSDEKDVAS